MKIIKRNGSEALFDVTKIAEASDFTGVEEESGCKS